MSDPQTIDFDAKFGAILDALSDLKLMLMTHARNQEELLTNVDAALRGVVAAVDAKVDIVAASVVDANTVVNAVKANQDRLSTRLDAIETKQGDAQAKLAVLDRVEAKIDNVRAEQMAEQPAEVVPVQP